MNRPNRLTRHDRRELERELRDVPTTPPPADLLDKIRADVPNHLRAANASEPRRPLHRRPALQLAATRRHRRGRPHARLALRRAQPARAGARARSRTFVRSVRPPRRVIPRRVRSHRSFHIWKSRTADWSPSSAPTHRCRRRPSRRRCPHRPRRRLRPPRPSSSTTRRSVSSRLSVTSAEAARWNRAATPTPRRSRCTRGRPRQRRRRKPPRSARLPLHWEPLAEDGATKARSATRPVSRAAKNAAWPAESRRVRPRPLPRTGSRGSSARRRRKARVASRRRSSSARLRASLTRARPRAGGTPRPTSLSRTR